MTASLTVLDIVVTVTAIGSGTTRKENHAGVFLDVVCVTPKCDLLTTASRRSERLGEGWGCRMDQEFLNLWFQIAMTFYGSYLTLHYETSKCLEVLI